MTSKSQVSYSNNKARWFNSDHEILRGCFGEQKNIELQTNYPEEQGGYDLIDTHITHIIKNNTEQMTTSTPPEKGVYSITADG